MDEEAVADRLMAAAGSTEVDLGATIRPILHATMTANMGTEDTLVASGPPAAHALPRITVSLPGSLSEPAVHSSDADLEVHGMIGEGGMGRVFLARQHSLARDVAIKTVRDSAVESFRRALVDEGVRTGQLEHPAIVPVHLLGLDASDRPMMVMKRVEGVTWEELLADPNHEGWESWEGDADDRLPGHLQILAQVCNAVHFAHSRGIVHRDLKPQNVLIGRFGDIYVADWGIAARIGVEADQRLCGTPGYMAPEMVTGAPIDARTDVYLLGAVLHEVLTGRHRHHASSGTAALVLATLSLPHEYDASVPPPLAELANRACSLKPDDRLESAMRFRDALSDYARHRQSIVLAGEAMERVVALRGLDTSEGDRRHELLSAEARFGFEQALGSWKDNPVAREGLAELDALLEERERRRAELAEIAREHDPSLSERQRRIVLSVLAVFAVLLGASAFVRDPRVTAHQVVFFGALTPIGMLIATFVMRKALLRNAFGRQTVSVVFIGAIAILIPRVADLWGDFDLVRAFTRDIFTLAGVAAVASVVLMRYLWWLVACLTIGGIAIILAPQHALPIFNGSLGLGFLISAIIAWSDRPAT